MRRFVRGVAVLIVSLISGSFAVVAAETPKFENYDSMRAEVVRLWNEEKFADAAAILEAAVDAWPEKLRSNTYNLALMRVRLGEPERAVDALRTGLDRGAWYGKYDFFAEVWAPMKALPSFAEIEKRCEARRAEEQKLVKPRLDVVVPSGVPDGAKLPLFIALHGGGENVDLFRPHWSSPLLEREFVVAYPQSTQLIAPDGYDWMQDVPLTLAELKAVHAKLVAEYPVDPSRVVIGGFSSGGAASLEVVLSNAFPVAGFVSLCPAKPDDFSAEGVKAAATRGVRGTLLTTERDGRLEAQKEMASVMKDAGLLIDFVVTPDIGHWYPPDLAERIDVTLRKVVSGEGEVIAAIVRDSIEWALTKDRARLESIFTHDEDLVIVHPDSKSTVRGWSHFAKMIEVFMDPRFQATRSDVRDLVVNVSRDGSVAWFSALLDDCGTWEGEESCWNDARWTGVLEKRGGAWVIVQMHFSLASDKVREECAVTGGAAAE